VPPEGTDLGCAKEGKTKTEMLKPGPDIVLTGGRKTIEACKLPPWLICGLDEKGERECIQRYTMTISGTNLEVIFECRKNDDGDLEWFAVGFKTDDATTKIVWGKKECKSCWPAEGEVNV